MTQEKKSDLQSNQNNKDAREIEAAISDTRSALKDDIKALSDKASPEHLKQEAKQALKNAKDNLVAKATETGAEVKDKALELKDVAVEKANEAKDLVVTKAQDAADAVAETAEEVATQTREAGRVAWRFTADNAVPLSLIGLGAGLLLSNQRKARRLRSSDGDGAWYEHEEDTIEDYPADNLAFASDDGPAPMARAKRKPAASALKQGKRLAQNGKRAYEKAGQRLEDAEHKLADSAARGREIVQDRYRSVKRASRDFIDANPLALAFGTLLAGVGVGLLLPSSSREDALLRPARARLRGAYGEARRTAQEVGDIAKETLHDVGRTAGDM